jgi:hypothetical protein
MLVVKSLRKWPPGRLRRRWEDNVKIELRDTNSEDVNWMELVQNCMLQLTL